jgi:hypothetical protein
MPPKRRKGRKSTEIPEGVSDGLWHGRLICSPRRIEYLNIRRGVKAEITILLFLPTRSV